MKRILLTLAALFSMTLLSYAQEAYVPSAENIAARERFSADRFGIFIHWGIYSMLGDGEWVMHNKNIDYQEYSRLAQGFCPSKFDASQWVSAIKGSGAKYITITSRHHDGFSMFDSKVSDYNVVDATPFGRDVIGELAEACSEQGIRLHLYYSHLDWGRTDYAPKGRTGLGTGRPEPEDQEASWEHYMDFVDAQLTELLTQYGPIGAIWFDGYWDKDALSREELYKVWKLDHEYELIHKLQPACLVGNNHHVDTFPGEDIQIFERDVPGHNDYGYSTQEISRLPLETCQTMNDSWGYRIKDLNYKSPEYLIKYLAQTAGKGANLLLNIGPRPDGTLPEEALIRLESMGKWLSVNGEAIYGTEAGYVPEQLWGVSTQKDNKLYIHVLEWQESILIPSGKNRVLSAYQLDGGCKVEFTQDKQSIRIQVPHSSDPDQVIVLEFKENL